MAALEAGAHAANSVASIHETPKDGLDNKERWHWKERDLKDWVDQWLMRAFVQFDDGKLFDNGDFRARCTTIRGDYDNGGEVFLNWRKGKCFATYNFAIRLEFAGSIFVGGRSIGQSKGVLRVYDIKYDDDDAADASRSAVIQGAWEVPARGQAPPPPGEVSNVQGLRDPVPYEVTFKDAVAKDGLAAVRDKLAVLRKALVELADADKDHKGKLPDATLAAQRHMESWGEAAAAAAGAGEPPASTTSSGSTLSPEAAAEAGRKAAEYIEQLRVDHRSTRFTEALGDPTMTHMNLMLCDIRPGRDISDLVDALKKNGEVETLDLRDNRALDDQALQPLLLAFANGVGPKLKTVLLKGTSHSVISENMAKGLAMMRKNMNIDFGDEEAAP
jgi:hypothetical protein